MDLHSMMIAELVGKSLLTAAFAYLYHVHRERWLGAWSLGWLCTVLYSAAIVVTLPVDVWSIANLLMIAAAAAFLSGTHMMANRRLSRKWSVALGAGIAWALIDPLFTLSWTIRVLPPCVIFGVAMIQVGWTLVRQSGIVGFEPFVAGGTCMLWGVHVMDFPFLGVVESFAPFGFLLSYSLQISCALGMLLVYLRRSHEELRKSQEQLAHAQKMEALGRLAGGVAHDFNNLLTVITGNLSLAEQCSEHENFLAEALHATQRAGALTRQLLGFSRKQVVQARVIDLAATVRDTTSMLERLMGDVVDIRVDGATPCWIRADAGHLEQIIINLAVNARDAMPEGGTLRVTTCMVDIDSPIEWVGGTLSTDRAVELRIVDTGVGIPVEVRDHLFEPFFTTKAAGKGTGIGLSTVRALVESAHGAIAVESDADSGTTFRLLFPAVAPPQRMPVDAPVSTELSGSETVVVAEDDATLRSLICEWLRECGYAVVEAANGEEAREAFARPSVCGVIDLLISDVVMPGESGVVLADALRKENPSAAILLISGYTAGGFASVPSGCCFLSKPFAPRELAVAVRQALDSDRVESPQ